MRTSSSMSVLRPDARDVPVVGRHWPLEPQPACVLWATRRFCHFSLLDSDFLCSWTSYKFYAQESLSCWHQKNCLREKILIFAPWVFLLSWMNQRAYHWRDQEPIVWCELRTFYLNEPGKYFVLIAAVWEAYASPVLSWREQMAEGCLLVYLDLGGHCPYPQTKDMGINVSFFLLL